MVITLIGGARRVTLAEQIKECIATFADVEFYSIEKAEDFYPISTLAKIASAPAFATQAFTTFLELHLKNTRSNAFACMDAAVPALATVAGQDFGSGRIIAPSYEGAQIGLNKHLTYEFCKQYDIAQPYRFYATELLNDMPTEKEFIAKPLFGFGSKGVHRFNAQLTINIVDFDNTHIIQEYIHGLETTHDLYIFANRNFISSSRDRFAVIDGEVDHCIVRESNSAELEIFKKIADTGLFWGPITVQTICSGDIVFLIEINTRFGGGVTASIQAGFPIIQAWAQESQGWPLPSKKFKRIEMKRARRDFYREIQENT